MNTGKPITDGDSGYDAQRSLQEQRSPFLQNGYLQRKYMARITAELYMGGKHRLSKDRCRTGYYVRKYLPESLNEKSSNKAYHNWIYFRLAEMYLNYAEALNESLPVPSTEVYNAVNAVRKRSGMPALPQGLSQTAMRQRIKNERR